MYKSKDDGNAHIRVIRDLILTIVSILLLFSFDRHFGFQNCCHLYSDIFFEISDPRAICVTNLKSIGGGRKDSGLGQSSRSI